MNARKFAIRMETGAFLTPDQQEELGSIVAGEIPHAMHHLMTTGKCDGIERIDVACRGEICVLVTRTGMAATPEQIGDIEDMLSKTVPVFAEAILRSTRPIPVNIMITEEVVGHA